VFTAYGILVSGIAIHVVLLAAFLALGAMADNRQVRAFALTMALAPIVRIISVVMPLASFPQPFWYLLTGLPLFAGIVSTARALQLSRAALNLRLPPRRRLRLDLLVAVSGVGLGMIEWKILTPKAAVAAGSPLLWLVGAALILLIFTGLLEELLFRGLVQRVCEDLLGIRGGILATASLFAILHIGWHSPVDLAFVFAVGLYFSLVVRFTRSLLGVSLAHGATNVTLFLIVPLFLRSMG